jgi:hypothetical protein
LIQKPWPRFQSRDYGAKIVPISQLGKDHCQPLIVAAEATISCVSAVALDTTSKVPRCPNSIIWVNTVESLVSVVYRKRRKFRNAKCVTSYEFLFMFK